MARMRASGMRVEYAGEVLLHGCDYLAEDSVELGRSFTTTAEAVVEADAPVIRAYGNAQGEYALAVSVDCIDKPTAMQELLRRVEFAEAHQTGELEVTVGPLSTRWRAGVTGVQGALSFPPGGGVRLTVQYAFVLGAVVPPTE